MFVQNLRSTIFLNACHDGLQAGCPYEIMAGLIRMGLDPNAVNANGDTALHIAAMKDHVEVGGGVMLGLPWVYACMYLCAVSRRAK